MRGVDFRQAYQFRLSDDLLRYTSLPVADVAICSGFASRVNLYFAYQRDLKTTPNDRREKLRQLGDEGRYKME
jgi:transcriptional regulator GlxA family with amidase domain